MDYCGPIGLPHSKFLGWSEEDQDKAIAWHVNKLMTCQCGTDPGEWIDKDGRLEYPLPYVLKTRKCWGCTMLEDKRSEMSPEDMSGISLYFERA